jgi:mRNA capping enzyme, beta chain
MDHGPVIQNGAVLNNSADVQRPAEEVINGRIGPPIAAVTTSQLSSAMEIDKVEPKASLTPIDQPMNGYHAGQESLPIQPVSEWGKKGKETHQQLRDMNATLNAESQPIMKREGSEASSSATPVPQITQLNSNTPSSQYNTPSRQTPPKGTPPHPNQPTRSIPPNVNTTHTSQTGPSAASPQGPPRKRPRPNDEAVPIFAKSVRKASRSTSSSPVMSSRRQPGTGANNIPIKQELKKSVTEQTTVKKESVNGQDAAPTSGPAVVDEKSNALAALSITGVIPYEELTRVVSDWLFENVVSRGDIGPGAEIEIEAKIGQLIDKNTNERLRLPVMTETVIAAGNATTFFKSSMTEVSRG